VGVRYLPLPKWQLPKCAVSQTATSTGCNGQEMRFGWAREPSTAAKTDLPLGKLHIREVVTWKDTLGRLPLGKNSLGKYLT